MLAVAVSQIVASKIDPAKTALVIANPQNDLLSEKGVTRGVVDKERERKS